MKEHWPPEPRILYAFQGTGNGHASRAAELVPLLKKYARVEVLCSGHNRQLSLDFPLELGPALVLLFCYWFRCFHLCHHLVLTVVPRVFPNCSWLAPAAPRWKFRTCARACSPGSCSLPTRTRGACSKEHPWTRWQQRPLSAAHTQPTEISSGHVHTDERFNCTPP